MKTKKIILASASPRRREILKENSIDFEVIVPEGDEKNIVGEKYSEALVNECAIAKAKSVLVGVNQQCRGRHSVVPVGADTIRLVVGADTIRPIVGASTKS